MPDYVTACTYLLYYNWEWSCIDDELEIRNSLKHYVQSETNLPVDEVKVDNNYCTQVLFIQKRKLIDVY